MAGCDVCIGGNVDEFIDEYERQVLVAQTEAKCEECRAAIQPGSSHELVTGVFMGEDYRFITCLVCAEIRDVFSCGEAVSHGNLWEDMREIAFERLTTASECFTQLSAAAKAKVLTKWQEWKGLRN
jgi:uncharacterized protein with PIN domain